VNFAGSRAVRITSQVHRAARNVYVTVLPIVVVAKDGYAQPPPIVQSHDDTLELD
jgi:hypothetical protein